MPFWNRKRRATPAPSVTGPADVERSASNAPIYRHQAVERALRMPEVTEPDLRDGIEAHLNAFLGDSAVVWHEIVSDLVHVDVLRWAPTEERPWYTFVTVGMSDLPMTVPPEQVANGVARRAERSTARSSTRS